MMVGQQGQVDHFGIGENDSRRQVTDLSSLIAAGISIKNSRQWSTHRISICLQFVIQCLQDIVLILGQCFKGEKVEGMTRFFR